MYIYVQPTIHECGECGSRNIARKVVQFGDPNVSGRLVCLDCGHTEPRPTTLFNTTSTPYTVSNEPRIVPF